jgi:hypothetical protein
MYHLKPKNPATNYEINSYKVFFVEIRGVEPLTS